VHLSLDRHQFSVPFQEACRLVHVSSLALLVTMQPSQKVMEVYLAVMEVVEV